VLDPRTSNSIPGSGLSSAAFPPLRRKQRRLVKDNPGVLAAVARGLKLAVDECQYQFKDRRWNCPTSDFLKEKNIFGKIVQIGKKSDQLCRQ
jgi:wingless-type MMTV integration site family protein 1